MMKLSPKWVLTTVVVSVLLPVAALAQSYKNQGYWVDGSGSIVTSPVAGMCWHSGEWTPALAVEPCDPVARRTAVVATPVEPVTPVVAQPRPMPTKLSFSADTLFGFNKSEITPKGKLMLDDLVRQLNDAQYDQIVLTGHADRIGRSQYNQKLSERRAVAVKDYLVKMQLPGERISAVGMGETEPVTQPADCAHLKMPKLIACLQPDRRVNVEMTGAKTMSGGR